MPVRRLLPRFHRGGRRLAIARRLLLSHQLRHPLPLLARAPLDLLILAAVLAALVLFHIEDDNAVRNPQDEEEPEHVEGLDGDEEGDGDGLGDPALVLLGVPVELEGADGAEFGEGGVDDEEVEVVPAVGPDAGEESEVGGDEGGGEVVEEFGGLVAGVSEGVERKGRAGGCVELTARKKSETSCVM